MTTIKELIEKAQKAAEDATAPPPATHRNLTRNER